ncbi:SCO1664 family protein [Brevibacterium paucivorans]|uniref:SCO1664 family protein n=1 Tax=Brevibacterium paucivorans TaxID=170994 RepID=UPI00321B999D
MSAQQDIATWPATVLGLIPDASNDTYLIVLTPLTGAALKAVYKPSQGEAFLQDFSELARREVAAYRLSYLSGLNCVPETIMRSDLPHGPGSVQLFVDSAGDDPVVDAWPSDHVPDNVAPVFRGYNTDGAEVVVGHALRDRLFDIAVFDVMANNADRKGSHVIDGYLPGEQEATLWAIDNGLSFHPEPKLRTVLWGFAGTRLAPRHLQACERTLELTAEDLGTTQTETHALHVRARALLSAGTFPYPPVNRTPIPWPPL